MTSTASERAVSPRVRGGLVCLFSGLLLGLAGVVLFVAIAMKTESVARQLGLGIPLLALPVLGVAIWLLASYLRLLRELAAAIQERAAAPGL